MKKQTSKIRNQTSSGGFTLIEVLVATMLVGFSIVALLAANGAFSMANLAGADLSTAEFLTEQIRELTTMLPMADPDVGNWTALGPEGSETLASYDDVDDFDGQTYSPPVASDRTVLNDLAAFSQQVVVEKVNPSNFDEVWADNTASNFARVTVTILQNGRQISSASWIRARY